MRIRYLKKKKKLVQTTSLNLSENLNWMSTQRPNRKGTFQNKLTSEDKTDNQKVCLFCVRLHESLNGTVKTIDIL
jgi:hypothetical protein